MDTIDILVLEGADDEEHVKGGIGQAAADAVMKKIPVHTLQTNMRNFVRSISGALADIGSVGNDYQLREIALQVELTAAGGVVLIGSAKIEGKGSISLRFAK